MTATIFGSFEDPAHAERAAGALLDHGLHDYDLSLLVHQDGHFVKSTEEQRRQREIDEHQIGKPTSSYAYADTPERIPVGPADGLDIPGVTIAHESLIGAATEPDAVSNYSAPRDPDSAIQDTTEGPLGRTHLEAKTGISTTTSADAGVGAAKGAAVGLGVGVLAALASVFIPGVGLVFGTGALAAAIAGTVGATGAGVIAGGLIGYLKDQGVPEDALTVYREAYDRGGAILAVNLPQGIDRADIEAVLAKYGAQNIDVYGVEI